MMGGRIGVAIRASDVVGRRSGQNMPSLDDARFLGECRLEPSNPVD